METERYILINRLGNAYHVRDGEAHVCAGRRHHPRAPLCERVSVGKSVCMLQIADSEREIDKYTYMCIYIYIHMFMYIYVYRHEERERERARARE